MSFYPFRRLLIPLVVLIITCLARDNVASLPAHYDQLLTWFPGMVFVISIALSIFFNRAHLFTASLAMLITYGLIQTQLQGSLVEPRTLYIYTMLSIMLPLTLLFICLLPDPGMRNRYGVLMAASVPAQWFLAWLVLSLVSEITLALFINHYLPVKPFAGYVLSVRASICFFSAVVAALIMLYRENTESEAALLSALVFACITFMFFDQPKISAIMFGAAGISMIISVIRSSHDMAYRDDLTGLLGRRALNERLKSMGKRYVIAMLDVDHFKKLNDTHGHDIGDEVLKMVAGQIARIGGGGSAYRYGGEEFCVVFTGKDIDQCVPFLEEVRINVSKYRLTIRNSKHRPQLEESGMQRRGRRTSRRDEVDVSVTISIGVSGNSEREDRPHKVLKAADTALYKAKTSGRNCLAQKTG